MKPLEVLGLVPARAGSRRVAGKNTAPVGGRPLVAWTLETALASPALGRVVVSTDDPAIAELARGLGAEAPFLRPAELAADGSPTLDAVLHALAWLAAEQGYEPDAVMVLQPTSPLRSPADIEEAVARLRRTGAPAVVSLSEAPVHPDWLRRLGEDDLVSRPVEPPAAASADRLFALNGAVYLVRRAALLEQRTLFPAGTRGLVMPAERSLDVDTPFQLRLADLLLERRPAEPAPTAAPFGGDRPCFLIAEAGVNHNGDPELALRMVEAAAAAGADAVKFQAFEADRLAAPAAPKAAYQAEPAAPEESQLEMLRRLELPDDAWTALKARADALGLAFLASPFDEASVDRLAALGVELFKVPSGEITNHPLLARVAARGRPVILSTGMSTLEEVRRAVGALVAAGDPPLALLHCVSAYPTAPADANLRAMDTLRRTFGVPVGFSDHSLGTTLALAAVARGAAIVEKHFTLDRSLPGPDQELSLEPDELGTLVDGARAIEQALGDGRKEPAASEAETARVARKSLVAAREIGAGEVFGAADLVARRPGTGLAPDRLAAVLGRRALRRIRRGEVVTPEMLE